MFSISNEELKGLRYAVDLANKEGYFEIIHIDKEGSEEICRVESSISEDGSKTWSLGGYTTKSGNTILAVVDGKVLKHIKIK